MGIILHEKEVGRSITNDNLYMDGYSSAYGCLLGSM